MTITTTTKLILPISGPLLYRTFKGYTFYIHNYNLYSITKISSILPVILLTFTPSLFISPLPLHDDYYLYTTCDSIYSTLHGINFQWI